MTQKPFLLSLLIILVGACNQGETGKPRAVASFTLPMPPGWEVETISIPIDFARSIDYKGQEDIRFMPGWAVAASNEYWSYCFLWSLQNKPAVKANDIAVNLKAYFTGLISRNIQKNQIPREKLFETETSFTKITTSPGDAETFQGTVHMLDYKKQEPMILNCIVHLRLCPGQNITYLFHELSPRPVGDTVWKRLDELWKGFSCIADTSRK
jgi:hypothetical protein